MHAFIKYLICLFFLILFACNKDNIQGWKTYIASPPPPKIKKVWAVIRNCVPPYPVSFYQEVENILGTMRYKWYFGDGQTSTDLYPSHIYNDTGHYIIMFVVWNEIGSDTEYIYLPELSQPSIPVVSNFTYSHYNNNNFAPNKVIFTNKSTGANLAYWYFGDGNETDNYNPTHIFQNSGNYVVKLKSICSNGNYDEYTQQIFISPPPTRIFIDSITLMLPKQYRNTNIYVEFYHNTTFVGRTITKSGYFPIKFKKPYDFKTNFYYDNVQFTSNEVFKFVILQDNGSENQPTFIDEIVLATVDIKNNFYPRSYINIQTVPPKGDTFIDLYISY
ncbi:MAG: PKD domain-containing protein [Bacteroidales bacterium]|nr:PKD domain-containing protein [Bacteroidales bacterium]